MILELSKRKEKIHENLVIEEIDGTLLILLNLITSNCIEYGSIRLK